MNTKSKAKTPKSAPTKGGWIRKTLWSLLGFVLGVAFGPMLQYEFFQSVPGPKASAKIQVFTDAGGCDLYSLQLSFPGNTVIDKVDFAVQFPRVIEDKRLGVSKQVGENFEYAGPFQFHGGKEACEFLSPVEVPPPSIQAVITWPNKFEFVGTDIHNPLSAEFIVPKDPRATALTGIYSEGSYEYRLFGIPVKKQISFHVETVVR
jgi:hypothetical protein